jgi:hypothetical protein
MPAPELIRAFLSQATASGARSTALQPLGWLAGILIVGLAIVPFRNAPSWLLILLAGLLVCCVVLYLLSYIYFAFKNPDALRSETFTLSKMALEKNLIGDNRVGLLELDDTDKPSKRAALPTVNAGGLEE